MLVIDGSQGEGGGQILRSSLALAMVTGTPVRIEHIRARRKQPGLRRQHLTAVNAAAAVCGARVSGAGLHSSRLDFIPGPVRDGNYHFDVGSAGSCTLVLQTVLPPLMLANQRSALTLAGGTHNPLAPPYDFLARTFLPQLARMGVHTSLTLERHGFYPRGGGRLTMSIEPARKLTPLVLTERGSVLHRRAVAIVAGLPRQIAEREVNTVVAQLNWPAETGEIRELDPDEGPGNVVLAEVESEHVTEVFAGFGERGVRAEEVARGVAQQVQAYLDSGAPVSEHLADQLLIPLALAGEGQFVTGRLSGHTTTNMNVVREFLPVSIEVSSNKRLNTVFVRQPS